MYAPRVMARGSCKPTDQHPALQTHHQAILLGCCWVLAVLLQHRGIDVHGLAVLFTSCFDAMFSVHYKMLCQPRKLRSPFGYAPPAVTRGSRTVTRSRCAAPDVNRPTGIGSLKTRVANNNAPRRCICTGPALTTFA